MTHDPDEAMRIADRIALLQDGRLVQGGRPEELYSRPATLFAARFFSDINELRGRLPERPRRDALGSFAAPDLADQAQRCASASGRSTCAWRRAHRHSARASSGPSSSGRSIISR